MTDWSAYNPFQPTFARPASELSSREARLDFNELMSSRGERRIEFARLLAASGIDLDSSDVSIQRMNEWFASGVEADERDPERLAPRWYAVVHDIGLFLGDVAIERFPSLGWHLLTRPKSALSFQKPVIVGYRSDKKYVVDFHLLTSVLGHRIIHGSAVKDSAFVDWLARQPTNR